MRVTAAFTADQGIAPCPEDCTPAVCEQFHDLSMSPAGFDPRISPRRHPEGAKEMGGEFTTEA